MDINAGFVGSMLFLINKTYESFCMVFSIMNIYFSVGLYGMGLSRIFKFQFLVIIVIENVKCTFN